MLSSTNLLSLTERYSIPIGATRPALLVILTSDRKRSGLKEFRQSGFSFRCGMGFPPPSYVSLYQFPYFS